MKAMKKTEINKTKENKQMMHSTIAQHLLTDAQPAHWAVISGTWATPSSYTLGTMSYGMEYPFG